MADMNGTIWQTAGAILGALGVTLGAFGAHGLDDYLTETGQAANFETAVRYQIYHALALVLLGVLAQNERIAALSVAGWCFLIGTALFSGCLYAYICTRSSFFATLIPFGGFLLIVGWIALAVGIPQRSHPDDGE
jgi:uncharacterized membrane protein YgdD (TMEM256/DUF423 family)